MVRVEFLRRSSFSSPWRVVVRLDAARLGSVGAVPDLVQVQLLFSVEVEVIDWAQFPVTAELSSRRLERTAGQVDATCSSSVHN